MSKTTSKKSTTSSPTIAINRKARHDYTIEKNFEAGIVLTGWEIKSIRSGKAQIADSYVLLRNGEAWLLGSNITPLISASSHVKADNTRTRKLLLHKREIRELIGHIERRGYTLIPLSIYWKHGYVKVEIALAKGKKQYDKRSSEKDKDWKMEQRRLLKAVRTR